MNASLYDGEYVGDTVYGRFVGVGKYTFRDGSCYEGTFLDGMFEGEGSLHVKGGKFVGTWEAGKLVEGTFVYDDGLRYKEIGNNHNTSSQNDWNYCSVHDPRYHHEIQDGIHYGDNLKQVTSSRNPSELPVGCYDTIDGYYDPKREEVCSYDLKEAIRHPESEEIQWIVKNCRVGVIRA